jgi:hypothetical protein
MNISGISRLRTVFKCLLFPCFARSVATHTERPSFRPSLPPPPSPSLLPCLPSRREEGTCASDQLGREGSAQATLRRNLSLRRKVPSSLPSCVATEGTFGSFGCYAGRTEGGTNLATHREQATLATHREQATLATQLRIRDREQGSSNHA